MASTFFYGMLITSAFFYIPALLGFFTPLFWLHFILGIPTLFTDLLISFGVYNENIWEAIVIVIPIKNRNLYLIKNLFKY